MSLSSQHANEAGHGHLAYNLAGIAVLMLLLAVGVAYLIDEMGRTSRPQPPALTDGKPVVQTIGGRELTIPTNWIRHGEQVKSGFAGQVDIAVELNLIPGHPPVPVNVSLLPGGRAKPSSTLLDTVYLHQFEGGTVAGPSGLVGKTLVSTNGYAGETVWYDPLSPKPFVAKCMAAVESGLPDQCLRTVRLPSGLAAIFTFESTALDGWRLFDAEMEHWLDRIGGL